MPDCQKSKISAEMKKPRNTWCSAAFLHMWFGQASRGVWPNCFLYAREKVE